MTIKSSLKKAGEKSLNEMNRYFTPFMLRISENRYLLMIRNGIVATIPLILVGSFFTVLYFFPLFTDLTITNPTTGLITNNVNNFGSWLLASGNDVWASFIMLPYRLTMYIMGFFAVWGFGASLAKSYKLDQLQVSFVCIVVYFASLVGSGYSGSVGAPTLAFAALGTGSIFGGIVISIFTVEVYRLCIKYNVTIRLPKQVPQVVAKPFQTAIPLAIATLIAVLVFMVLKFDIHAFTNQLFAPLQSFIAGNNAGGMIVLILLITLLWSAGIHGVSVIGSLARPFWQTALDANTNLVDSGNFGSILLSSEGGNILPEGFYQWFVWIGGAGATIGLIISMLIVAKSKFGKTITRTSAIPSIFNINEPIIFGFPIMLNPILIVPFILAPLVTGIISYLVISWGWVGVPYTLPAWTLPAPVGAFFATLDWRSIILVFANIIISTLIYLPFAKVYDKQLYKSEVEALENDEKIAFYLSKKKISNQEYEWIIEMHNDVTNFNQAKNKKYYKNNNPIKIIKNKESKK